MEGSSKRGSVSKKKTTRPKVRSNLGEPRRFHLQDEADPIPPYQTQPFPNQPFQNEPFQNQPFQNQPYQNQLLFHHFKSNRLIKPFKPNNLKRT